MRDSSHAIELTSEQRSHATSIDKARSETTVHPRQSLCPDRLPDHVYRTGIHLREVFGLDELKL
jgi:hypothetical protein